MRAWRTVASLLLAVAVCIGVGGAASWITAGSVTTWYPTLEKPSWTPPDRLFGPVWTLLYIAMGVSVWLVWRAADRRHVRAAIGLFAVQLVLNAAWSFLFFGARSPGWALVDIGLLWLAIAATTAAFARIDLRAAALLVPYLAWVSYAAALNFAIWKMNP